MKKLLLCILLMFNFSIFVGCSSSEVEEGDGAEASDSAEKADASDDEDEEFDSDEELADEDEGDDEDFEEDGEGDEEVAEEGAKEGEEPAEEAAEEQPDEVLAEEDATENAEETEQEIEEQGDVAGDIEEEQEPAEPAEEDMGVADTEPEESTDSFGEEDDSMAEKPSWVPVRKIAEAPFNKNGVLANSLYVVRDGDTMESISQKIYGEDRTEDLYKVNTTLRNGVKVGDKVYHNSPKRPGDDTQMMTYYQDLGLEPEIYVSKPGDNIRAVANTLLGNERSWMELYATNPSVDSKGELSEGTELRYWSGGGSPDMSVASNDIPPADMPPADLPPEPEPPAMPEPPTQASNPDMPPPPGAMGSSSNEMPPPPPPTAAANLEPPPPPPPPRPKRVRKKAPVAAAGDDQDQLMYLAGGAILLLLAVAIAVIRKKKSRQMMDFNTTTHTQID